MLKNLIPYIDENVNRFNKKYGLAERVIQTEGEDTIVFPAVYLGNEEYEPVNFEIQSSYHRMNGQTSVETTENNTQGCSKGLTITYNMVMVGCLEIDENNQYRFEEIANKVAGELMALSFTKSCRRSANAYSIELNVKSINSDRTSVWSNEFDGVAFNIKNNYTLFSIGYDLVLLTDSSCLSDC